MDPSLVNQIVVAAATLLASLGGYLIAGGNERRRDEHTLKRELRLRISERGAQLDDNRHTLQRDTLLALQDAMQSMVRLTAKAMHFEHMQARQGEYARLPENLSEELMGNAVEVRRLASRILDSDVRDAVDEFIALSTRLSLLPKSLKGLTGTHLEDQTFAKLVEFDKGFTTMTKTWRNRPAATRSAPNTCACPTSRRNGSRPKASLWAPLSS